MADRIGKPITQRQLRVGEMIKQCDEVKYVNDISANVELCLTTSRETILNSAKLFEEK